MRAIAISARITPERPELVAAVLARPLGTDPGRRASTRLEGGDIVVEAEDLAALRASLNATCRWLGIIFSMDEVM